MYAIIGAGIVGVSAAIWLQRQGHEVTLIDREGPAAGTSFGNAGVVVPSGIVPINSPGLLQNAPRMLLDADSPLFIRWGYLPRMAGWLYRYARRANARNAAHAAAVLRILLADSVAQHRALAADTSAEPWQRDSDYLFVYPERAQFEKDNFGWRLRRDHGITFEELDSTELAAYDPAFAGCGKFAVKLPGHMQITDPGVYVKALAEHFVANGGKLLRTEVTGFAVESNTIRALHSPDGDIDCRAALITGGVWSKPLMARLGIRVPMETERGYHIELVNPSVMPRSALMLAASKFVLAPLAGRIRCAGIVEFGGLKRGPNPAALALMRRQIARLCPDLKFTSTREWLGHRPAPVDSIPFIGPVPGINGVYAGFGHHHVGMSAGPVTGRILAALATGQAPDRDISACAPGRFTGAGR